MKTVAIINLKGGCGKTTTALAMAHQLTTRHDRKVLLIDNDKQGNASRTTGTFDRDQEDGSENILLGRLEEARIIKTENENLDIIPCNMYMKLAEQQVMQQKEGKQWNRCRKALDGLKNDYDFCIIDNPPDLGMNVINAITAADLIIIPVQMDQYGLDGLEELADQVEQFRELSLPTLKTRCLITDYEKSLTSAMAQKWLREESGQEVYDTVIRHSKQVKPSTISHKPITEYSIRSAAGQDYKRFTCEFLEKMEG